MLLKCLVCWNQPENDVICSLEPEGIRGWYRGLLANYLKVGPSIAVSFVTYEYCKWLIMLS